MVDSVDAHETASSALYFNAKRTASVGALVDAWCAHCWQGSRPANLQFVGAVGFLNRDNVVQDLCAYAESDHAMVEMLIMYSVAEGGNWD